MTSYHDDLVEMMSKSARKLHAARRGQLLPSQLHHSLRVLDPFSENVLTAPLLEFFLFALFWLAYATSTIISLFWSTYQAAHQAILFSLTWWRVDMLSGYQPGPRVSEREFSSSRTFSMADVRACQQAFSGAEPGSAIAGVPRAERDKARNKAGHVTLNDVVCAVMADVLARVIAQKPGNQLKGPWTRIKRWLRKYLPSPIGFFMYVSLLISIGFPCLSSLTPRRLQTDQHPCARGLVYAQSVHGLAGLPGPSSRSGAHCIR